MWVAIAFLALTVIAYVAAPPLPSTGQTLVELGLKAKWK